MKNIYPLIFISLLALALTSCNQRSTVQEEKVQMPTQETIEETTIQNEDPLQETTISLVAEEVSDGDILNGPQIIETILDSELSEIERTSLIYMREEEKLARDVYLELYDTWGQQIFSNIASSEQSHTDAVKTLLERYDIPDPVTDDVRWVFSSPVLQWLYNTLVAQWNLSLTDALIVGATIEDLDIKDLQDASAQIDNEDILLVYANLERGSRNHMRAFAKNLTNLWISYTPVYISQADYDAIITSDTERGGGSGTGSGMQKWKNR